MYVAGVAELVVVELVEEDQWPDGERKQETKEKIAQFPSKYVSNIIGKVHLYSLKKYIN